MPLDFFTGELTEGPVTLDPESVKESDCIYKLKSGESAFMDIDCLWVHPETNGLYLHANEATYDPEELRDKELNALGMLRVIAYQGAYVVDISHTAEFVQDRTGESLPFYTPPSVALDALMSQSVPVAGLIQDALTLQMFNGLLEDAYGKVATLSEIEIIFSEDD